MDTTTFQRNSQQKWWYRAACLILVIATLVHMVSYGLPNDSAGYLSWGEAFGVDLLERLLSYSWWLQGVYVLLAFGIPVIMMAYAFMYWVQEKPYYTLPPVANLAVGLLLPNLIVPMVVFYAKWKGEIAQEQELLGYWVWNASFWLFFLGLWLYKISEPEEATHLTDHLIPTKNNK